MVKLDIGQINDNEVYIISLYNIFRIFVFLDNQENLIQTNFIGPQKQKKN